ncbi:MAG: hypothetical protein DRJ59_03510 [Thermoprotei archaeon]|nr:MAG: hypothetical protein DRJ59_03510 [Thermoprotei archaeon]
MNRTICINTYPPGSLGHELTRFALTYNNIRYSTGEGYIVLEEEELNALREVFMTRAYDRNEIRRIIDLITPNDYRYFLKKTMETLGLPLATNRADAIQNILRRITEVDITEYGTKELGSLSIGSTTCRYYFFKGFLSNKSREIKVSLLANLLLIEGLMASYAGLIDRRKELYLIALTDASWITRKVEDELRRSLRRALSIRENYNLGVRHIMVPVILAIYRFWLENRTGDISNWHIRLYMLYKPNGGSRVTVRSSFEIPCQLVHHRIQRDERFVASLQNIVNFLISLLERDMMHSEVTVFLDSLYHFLTAPSFSVARLSCYNFLRVLQTILSRSETISGVSSEEVKRFLKSVEALTTTQVLMR